MNSQRNSYTCGRQKAFDFVHTWEEAQAIINDELTHALSIPLYFVRKYDVRTNTGFEILYVHTNHAEHYSRMLDFSTCTLKCNAYFIKTEARSKGYLMLHFIVSLDKHQIPCCISEDLICWQFQHHLPSAHQFLLNGGQTTFLQRPLRLSRYCDDWKKTLRTAAILYELPQHAHQQSCLRNLATDITNYFACMVRAAATESSVERVYKNLFYCMSVLKHDFQAPIPVGVPLIVRQCIDDRPPYQQFSGIHGHVHILCGHWVIPNQKNWVEPCAMRCQWCTACAVTRNLSTDTGNHILSFLKMNWSVNDAIVSPHIARICFEMAQNTY